MNYEKLEQAARQALEALGEIEWSNNSQWQSDRAKTAITALRKALDRQIQAPVTLTPDGSAFAVMSYPLPKTHWLDSRRSKIYQHILAVWDQLGPEFKAQEFYALTGIENVSANRILVASVLVDSFGCTIVEDYTPRRRWRKGQK